MDQAGLENMDIPASAPGARRESAGTEALRGEQQVLLTARFSLSPLFFEKAFFFAFIVLVCMHITYTGWPPCGGQMTAWGPEMGLRFSTSAAGACFLCTEPSRQSLVFIFIYF